MKRFAKLVVLFILVLSLVSCSILDKRGEPNKAGNGKEVNEKVKKGNNGEPVKAIQLGSVPLTYKDKFSKLKDTLEDLEGDFGKGLDEFTIKLAKEIFEKNQKENIAFSPISLHYALSILANGTDKNSKEQVLNLLGHNDVEKLNKNNLTLLSNSADNNKQGIYDVNNSLWLSDAASKNIKKGFIEAAEKYYLAPVFKVDFNNPSTAETMSKWVSDMTREMIEPEFKFDTDQILTILNTLYFDAKWNLPFDEEMTRQMDFIKADSSSLKKDFMHMTEEGSYYKGDNFTKASKTFVNGVKLSFILPDKGHDINDLIKDEKLLGEMLVAEPSKNADINWFMPKFKLKSEIDLIGHMNSLGVKDIFDPKVSDFSKLTDLPMVSVNTLRQICAIEIDEEGGKAAAMTEVGIEAKSAPVEDPEKIEMKLDRPFLYILSNDAYYEDFVKDVPIMMGIVGEPNYE